MTIFINDYYNRIIKLSNFNESYDRPIYTIDRSNNKNEISLANVQSLESTKENLFRKYRWKNPRY